MPKLKKEFFSKPVRFTHRFGDKDDPHVQGSEEYFSFEVPRGVKVANGATPKPFIGKERGLHVWTEPQSPVTKATGGRASLSGPRMDEADMLTEAIPVGTRKRGPKGVN